MSSTMIRHESNILGPMDLDLGVQNDDELKSKINTLLHSENNAPSDDTTNLKIRSLCLNSFRNIDIGVVKCARYDVFMKSTLRKVRKYYLTKFKYCVKLS